MVPNPTVNVQGVGSVTAEGLNSYIQACSSLTQLRSFVGIGQMAIYLEGYVFPGDGGQGTFIWNGTAPGPDDGVNVIMPVSVVIGAWIRQTGVVTRTLLLSGVYINPNAGGTPAAAQLLDMWVLEQNTTFPANFAGAVFHVENAGLPATTRNCIINLNDAQVGTLTVNTNGTYAYGTTSPSGFVAASQQWLTLVAPASVDTTWNLFGFTLVGATS